MSDNKSESTILEYEHPQLFWKRQIEFVRGNQDFHAIFRFRSGYGASVIRTLPHRGVDRYELAVVVWCSEHDEDWMLCYSTHITNDVIGYLAPSDVVRMLGLVAELPPDAYALPGANLD